MIAPIPPNLRRAYRRTNYRVGELEIRIGRRSAAMDTLLASQGSATAILLSAWNPLSRRMPAGWNQRMHRALAEALHRHTILDAEGAWRGWREAHLMVYSQVAPMQRMARHFRQRAVVQVGRAQPARLLTVRRQAACPDRGTTRLCHDL